MNGNSQDRYLPNDAYYCVTTDEDAAKRRTELNTTLNMALEDLQDAAAAVALAEQRYRMAFASPEVNNVLHNVILTRITMLGNMVRDLKKIGTELGVRP